jgi:fatty acid desaturase
MSRWLFWAMWEWSLIAAALWMAAQWPWLIPVAVLVIGSRQQALGILGHEIAHKTVPIPDWLCNLLCFWPVGGSVQGYRAFHLPHHRHLGHPDLDPELPLRRQYGHRFDLTRYEKARLFLSDCVGINALEPLVLIRVVGGSWSVLRGIWMASVWIAMYAVAWWLPLVWGGSLLTTFWAFHRARTWREHYYRPDGVMDTYRLPPAWWERMTYLPHRIYRHWDHHQPGRGRVPCWQLRD